MTEQEREPRESRKPRTIREERGVKPARRVPAWVVVPFAVGAGWFVSGVPGGIFGLVVGLVLWWSRR